MSPAWYARLLRLYPPAFRARFEEALREAFQDQRRDFLATSPSRPARVRFWVRALGDVVAHGLLERLAEARARRPLGTDHVPPRGHGMRSLWQDLRFAVRTHAANRAATAVAVLVLAIAIGANTAIFSVVEGVLLRSLPFRDPEQLVGVGPIPRARRAGATIYGTASRFAFDVWAAQRDAFEDVAGYRGGDPVLSGRGDPERVIAVSVTPNFFPLLGAAPLFGRAVTRDDARPDAPPVAVLGYALWASRFGADPSAIGRTVVLDGTPHTIVGVMPRAFRFPESAQLWRALATPAAAGAEETTHRPYGGYWTVARLRPGVTPAHAMARLDVTTARLERNEGESWSGVAAVVIPLRDQLVGEARRPLLLVTGAVVFVLLVACANVANIQLARGVARRREVAVRLAIGAGRGRLVRQLLTESVLLALAGGALGVALAYVGVPLLVALGGDELPHVSTIGVNARVLAATLLASVLTGIAFGLAPALQSVRRASPAALKEAADVVEIGGERRRAGDVLVVAQVALTMMLLVGAALLGASFARLVRGDPGFEPDGVLVAQIELRGTRHAGEEPTRRFAQTVLERARAIPGVTAAAVSSGTPLAAGDLGTISVVDGPTPQRQAGDVTLFTATTAEYFRTLGIPLRRGRLLADDAAADRGSIVVSEALARRFFPGRDPIGHVVEFYGTQRGTIVGVVGDAKGLALDQPAPPHIYQSFAAAPAPYVKLVVRGAGDAAALAGAVRTAIRTVDATLPVDQITTMRGLMSESLTRQRFYAVLLGVFATSALVMAAAGIYGVVSYGVTRRTPELGVRVALGATRGDVLRLVVGRSGRLVAAGIVIGGVGAAWATRVLRAMLYEVSPTDPRVLAGVAAVLGVVALVAAWVPGRRAARVDPTRALRAH
ncbi:permease [Gemmatirosa kalamazoonensis]|uniref:Permease n=1 Tax=Gemmatirosa kalamazoonensis TaxID=861299 RepID=W0RBV5_9BACT|nr:ABC transporter permease [Gemmatirosa kalamazoonensis]AHG87795.1 permease [Gemmatirosa kalamazoonensis]